MVDSIGAIIVYTLTTMIQIPNSGVLTTVHPNEYASLEDCYSAGKDKIQRLVDTGVLGSEILYRLSCVKQEKA